MLPIVWRIAGVGERSIFTSVNHRFLSNDCISNYAIGSTKGFQVADGSKCPLFVIVVFDEYG